MGTSHKNRDIRLGISPLVVCSRSEVVVDDEVPGPQITTIFLYYIIYQYATYICEAAGRTGSSDSSSC